ncbi:MAG: 50S ribosomal protein L21 [Alphaproteobacteria bacterium]|nr:MAG: 50S ribosomal protein L21 [Alphaproteobacteria bacterium]
MNVHAVIQLKGHQYFVKEGDYVRSNSLDLKEGDTLDLECILAKSTGKTRSVKAEVVKHDRTGKVIVFKKIRRHNSRKFNTHRQGFTLLKILSLNGKE